MTKTQMSDLPPENINQGSSETESPAKVAPNPATGTRFSAKEIYENVRLAAQEELQRPAIALFWSSIAAGMMIGFSFLTTAYLAQFVADKYRIAVSAVGYPLGFIFVVLARNQLFTENTLEPVIPLLRYPSLGILKRVLSLWAVVLIGNLSGAFAFALFVQRTPLIDGELNYSLIRTAEIATAGGFWLVAYKAIFGGWLIALMAWLIASTHYTGAQVVLIWLTTAPIAAFGFKHSIAGAVEAFYLAFAGASWQAMIFDFIVPAIIGNIIGGVFLVAILNHGQVAADNASSNSRFFK